MRERESYKMPECKMVKENNSILMGGTKMYQIVYFVVGPCEEEDTDYFYGCWYEKENAEEYIKSHKDSEFLYIMHSIIIDSIRIIELIKKLRTSKKPDTRFLDIKTVEKLKNPDCLSINCHIARNGGYDTIPFIEGTPELIALLKEIYK